LVDIDKSVISRLSISGQKFEVLVDPNKALEFKKGAKLNVADIIAYPGVYKDVRSTDRVSEQDLQKTFGTTDVMKATERIIREGELQLTTEQRRNMVEQKRTQIANIIAKKGINPQTNTPHPLQRILNVMDKVGINVDPFIDAEQQVDKVLKQIKPIIPIKLQKIVFQIKIPAQYAGGAYSTLKRCGPILSEQWLSDGSLRVDLEILAGMQEDVFKDIASLTKGDFESKILKKEDI
jgi:ribosome maturation protein SDO1